jgi:hypothetical protein
MGDARRQNRNAGDSSSDIPTRGMGTDVEVSLSPTVQHASESPVRLGKEAGAATFAGQILREHPDYAGGRARSLALKATPQKRAASEWLVEVRTLFDWARIRKLSPSEQGPVLHGRLMVVSRGRARRRRCGAVRLAAWIGQEFSEPTAAGRMAT